MGEAWEPRHKRFAILRFGTFTGLEELNQVNVRVPSGSDRHANAKQFLEILRGAGLE